MAHEVTMPQLSQSVVEGEVSRWLVREGDRVEVDQIVAEIVTDKVDVELPSPVAGTVLKIAVGEGVTVAMGAPLLYIGEPGESLEEGATRTAAVYSSLTASLLEVKNDALPPEGQSPAAAEPATPGKVRAVPAVRKAARELGVDLATVRGSGPDGRITLDDVRAAAPPSTEEPGVEYRPYSGRRRQIGERLTHAKRTIPHASTMEELEVTELVALRARQREAAAERGVKLTYLAYLAHATVHTLARHPLFNSTLDEERQRIVVRRNVDLGIAVDTEEGLVVPVLRSAHDRGLLDLAAGIQDLAERARAGTLAPEEVRGSTFTISSVGSEAVLFSVGVINAPEVALLSLHRIEERPAVVDGAVAIRSRMYVTLTLDHRVLDGGHVVGFLRDLKARVESVGSWAADL